MKLFIIVVACLVGAVHSGEFLESTADKFGKWAKFKAMETCFGEEATRNYILKLKKAHAKCSSTELAPEAQLELSQSSTKFIKALLDGSAQEEKETLARLKDALGFRSSPVQYAIPYPVAFPYAQQGQKAAGDSGDEVFDLMKKFMVKKFLKKFSDDDDMDLFEKKRNRREGEGDADEEDAGEALSPEFKGLGERLNAKIAAEKAAFSAKLGNFSCVLQELNLVDQDLELNLEGSLAELKNSGIADEWFLNAITEEEKKCYAKAQALPKEVLEGCILGPKWAKVKEYMCCCKEAKMNTCMIYDTRKKLEANFGSVEKLREQTGLGEKELYFTAMKIIFGSMDME